MKKFFSAFLAFLLMFTTLGPMPGVAASFPGSVPVSVDVGTDDKVSIPVTMNDGNSSWQIVLRNKNTNAQVGSPLGSNNAFTDISPGLYIVEATKTVTSTVDGEDVVTVITETSPTITVRPRALTDFDTAPYKLIVKGAMIGSEVNLYKPGATTPYKTVPKVDTNKEADFGVIDASQGYRVTQTFNGAESTQSGAISVKPDKVIIQSPKDSGATNNLGELSVVNTKKDNMLILYRAENAGESKIEEKRMPSTGATHKFDGLRAGAYTVRQIEDGLESELSNELVIKNQQKPILELEGPATIELHHNVDSKDTYTEFGFKVTDKNGDTKQRTEGILCTTGVKIGVDIKYLTFNGYNTKPNPGEYIVRYTATDCTDTSLFTSVDRKVIVYPETIELVKTKNTLETHGTSPIENHLNGEIIVGKVFNDATLTLYQDASGNGNIANATIIQKKVKANTGQYTFSGVPVGIGYFVVQEFSGVQSENSERIDILDTTSPEITLKENAEMEIEVGTPFVDPGYTIVDNIDAADTLRVIIRGDKVNNQIPGKYSITYDATDSAGNPAKQLTRTVTVRPKPVIAIGSIATIGEVGVTNIFPGTMAQKTILKLYKANSDGVFTNTVAESIELSSQESTHVFKGLDPGRYRVKQEVNGISSTESNTVVVADIDKPYITINGPEQLSYVLYETKEPYYTGNPVQFNDPGMTAKDYLETILTNTAEMITPDGTKSGCPNAECTWTFNQPGMYKIIYNSTAPKRNKEADPKYRTITVAPQKTGKPSNIKGTITATVNKYPNSTTTAQLYNAYDQLMATDTVTTNNIATFTNIPAGIGYYVTQTVNGIESQPSLPVNVSIFDDVGTTAQITSFNFKEVEAISVIDHEAGKISVTVPAGTDRTNLTPVITSVGKITYNPEKNFSKLVNYTVVMGTSTKNYTVTVTVAEDVNSDAKPPITKKIIITNSNPSHSLTSSERRDAMERGITFTTSDQSIYIPASNVIESNSSTLTITEPAKGTFDIKWGNLSHFMQPLELELPKSGTKVLARIIEVGGVRFTIELPSTTKKGAANKIIGLLTEPGTYALVDRLGAPTITGPTIENGKTYYTLLPATDAITNKIYYTTNSKDISFISSARTDAEAALNNKYVPHSALLNWTEYTPGEKIEVPANELYAVVIKNGQISPIAALDPEPSTDWSKNIPAYDTHKVLSIKFNAKVDRKALYSGLIYVTNDATNQRVATELQMSVDGKTIYVIPKLPYARGNQYTLHIDRQFKGNTKNKEFLKKSLIQTFKIK
ncbi:DUF5011 domain-containing protein [Sporosarcina sp. GW1-11]|uniref:DUF5011 domain-containing protein n=1 Tax=Sporosarcina sp. GW1-11 TaxID=2899126 RepID=UPI00294C9A46|nr:DUF5011 domain-containing protein [Sporosarcina sp. GW1-11]MDV6378754.1 DUF5011 domain-containing protein [Sporosarcina sp. GW1-11]